MKNKFITAYCYLRPDSNLEIKCKLNIRYIVSYYKSKDGTYIVNDCNGGRYWCEPSEIRKVEE